MMRSKLMFLFLVLSALSLTVSAQDNPCGVEGVVVEASSFQYAPASVAIEVGQTVVWVNMGGTHDVNAAMSSVGDMWDNPETFTIPAVQGSSEGVCIGSHTFTVEGTYDYDCSIGNHAANGMVASVTVNPATQSNSVVDIIVNSEDHTVLEAAVIEANLAGTLSGDGPFTVFAPTDDAFATLLDALGYTAEELLAYPGLTDILLYHVVGAQALSTDFSDVQQITTLLEEDVVVTINENGVFINQSQVTTADIVTDNGVVHVIDAVLVPEPAQSNTVVDIIVNSEVHTVLEDAVVAAGLVDALNGAGPFTVFAPTDDAFTALLAALGFTAEELLAYPGLTDVLLYHVVGAQALSTYLSDGQQITTLLGVDFHITITGGDVFINQAQVIVADLIADNGVVHVIDAVLMPYLTGCTEISACNFDPNAEEDDGSCEYQSCAGCMDAEACNFDAEFSIAINDECTYPGCSDPLAINYNADAGCPLDCIYLTFDCTSVGNAAWTDESIGVFPDWQEAMVGVEWSGDWVFNIPELVEEPQSGVDYGVHHVDWISFEGLPNWIEESDFALGELSQSSQHCITATGIPTEPGVIEVIATGEVFISLFGAEFSIGEQSFSAILEVIDNPNLIPGCMYETALNYLSYAEIDDGSCLFAGCTDESAGNYSPLATIDDGSCGEPCSTGGDSSCATDVNYDGAVNVSDLLLLLSEFGANCD